MRLPHCQNSVLIPRDRLETHLGLSLTDKQYQEIAFAISELANILIESELLSPILVCDHDSSLT